MGMGFFAKLSPSPQQLGVADLVWDISYTAEQAVQGDGGGKNPATYQVI